jgi:hypothetical protein
MSSAKSEYWKTMNSIQKEREAQMEKKKKENELTLKQAKLAWANGEELQIDSGGGFYDLTGDYCLFVFDHPSNKFRLKPKTITLNGVEIPAPFEPKEGDKVWFLDDDSEFGYGSSMEYGKDIESYFGWWRTEAEIKQVVAALRSAFSMTRGVCK